MNTEIEEFQKTISRELIAIKDRVRKLIGDAHWGEEGRYKESILKNVISRFLPRNLSLGTGFIVSMKRKEVKRSGQIDIIIYDNSYPLLFSEGDFIVTTPDSVRALIEVKTSVSSGDIIPIIRKATENAALVPKAKFNGIFAFEKSGIKIQKSKINQNLRQSLYESKGAVNHLCLGEKIFIKYWKSGEKRTQLVDNVYSFYDIQELAFSYFISNLVESIAPKKVLDKTWFLYPIKKPNGKEDALITDLSIRKQKYQS
ncbi:DUF6602 domain-containing protein [Thalassobacillus devorans]|uniref:DUF6602 domain-containing protein n=1 Tax=Thalassobacillus devorans TaxID=279813 RepID=UPI000A1CA2F9|nr:DUF6602 domain-containing protein [Thalassobacillus devorans]